MSSEQSRFNDVIKADAEVRNGAGGQFASKYNLPFQVSISLSPNQGTTIRYTVNIPANEIEPLADELRQLLGDLITEKQDLKLAKNIRFELDANGNIAPKSLNIDGANIAQVIMEQIDESPANCEICQAQQGAKYGFYYGKVLSSSSYTTSSGAMSTTTTTTSFDIGGRKTVAVCDSCRQKYYWKSLGKALVIAVLCSIPLTYFLTVAMWISGSQEGFGAVLSILSIPFLSGPLALAGLIPLLEGVLGEGSKGAGEKAARDLKQPDLKAQGYDKFWTSKQYEKLKTSGRNF